MLRSSPQGLLLFFVVYRITKNLSYYCQRKPVSRHTNLFSNVHRIAMSWNYLIAFATDVIGLVVGVYFILSDNLKYSSGTHTGPLPYIALGMSAWIGISYYLYHHGSPRIASVMAWIPAVPLLCYGLFVLLFIVFKPDMR